MVGTSISEEYLILRVPNQCFRIVGTQWFFFPLIQVEHREFLDHIFLVLCRASTDNYTKLRTWVLFFIVHDIELRYFHSRRALVGSTRKRFQWNARAYLRVDALGL